METIEGPMSLKDFIQVRADSPQGIEFTPGGFPVIPQDVRRHEAASFLRSRQQGYPDYHPDDWFDAVTVKHSRGSVRKVASVLYALTDDSLRGIEVNQRRIAELARVSQMTVSRCMSLLESEGFVYRYSRPKFSDGVIVTQWPDVYRLAIPGRPEWGLSGIPEGIPQALPEVTVSIPNPDFDGTLPVSPDNPRWIANPAQDMADDGPAWLRDWKG